MYVEDLVSMTHSVSSKLQLVELFNLRQTISIEWMKWMNDNGPFDSGKSFQGDMEMNLTSKLFI